MDQEKLARAVQGMVEREQQRQAAAVIEAQTKVLSSVFDKSAAYTNLIVLAGYAGFFGLWQLTKEYVTADIARLSALFMLVSVVTFVAFEVVKMVVIQHNIMEKAKVLKSPAVQKSSQAFISAFTEMEAVHERVQFHFMRFWLVAMLVTILSGMTAASLLGYAFVSGLSK